MLRCVPPFRAAAVQAAPVWMDTAATVEKACGLIREAAANGARLIAFPEVFVPAYPYWNWLGTPFEGSRYFAELALQAVVVGDEHTAALCRQARESDAVVVIGINERHPESFGTLYNTNLIIGSDGTLLARHRKLVPTWAEKLTWAGGDGSSLRAHDTPVGSLGTLCCGENTNTLARFALLADGEQVHVANYPAIPFAEYDMGEAIKIRAGAHAFEGKVFVLVASSVLTPEIVDAVAPDARRREAMTGSPNALSAIFGPDGTMIAGPLIDEPGIVYADIDVSRSIELKQMHDIVGHYNRFDVLQLTVDRRPLEPLRGRAADSAALGGQTADRRSAGSSNPSRGVIVKESMG